MIEAFARGLVDQIMLEAMDVFDTHGHHHHQNEEHWTSQEHNAIASFEMQPSHIITQAELHDHTHVDYSQQESAEAVATKTACDLRNAHVDDSSPVQPSVPSTLERQIEQVVRNVSHAPGIVMDVTEIRHNRQGQGDVDQILHSAILETEELTDTTTLRKEKKNFGSSDVTVVSADVIHRMIEELETSASSSKFNNPGLDDQKPDQEEPTDENIFGWEEKEKFVRLIEGVGEDEDNEDNEKANETPKTGSVHHLCFMPEKETKSTTTIGSASSLKAVSLDEDMVGKTTTLRFPYISSAFSLTSHHKNTKSAINANEADAAEEKSNKKKRRSLGSRIKRFFRVAFSRQKH